MKPSLVSIGRDQPAKFGPPHNAGRRSLWNGRQPAIAVLLATALMTLSLPQIAEAQVLPNPTIVYGTPEADFVWTHQGGGVYVSPNMNVAEDFDMEIWERPIKDDEFTSNVTGEILTWTTTAEYFGYADISQVAYAFDTAFMYVSIQVVGGFLHTVGGEVDTGEGMEGHYYFYFGDDGTGRQFAMELDDPSDSSDINAGIWTSDTGKVRWHTRLGYDGGFAEQTDPGDIYARVTMTNTIEMALRLSELSTWGWYPSDFLLPGSFGIAGAGEGEPSQVDLLFANDPDHFDGEGSPGQGLQYDTLRLLLVPEPGRGLLVAMAAFLMLGLHRRRPRA